MSSTIYANKHIASLTHDYLEQEQNINALIKTFNQLIILIGEDPERTSLKNTAQRAAKAWLSLTTGYSMNPQDIINNALFDCHNDEMVIVKNIELSSICEHHLLPFIGKCHVGYVPNGKVVGLSKIARIIDVYAKRLQLQEKLTQQIAECFMQFISPKGVIVAIEATHLCMSMRGIKKDNAVTKTLATTGILKDNSQLKQEFLNAIN